METKQNLEQSTREQQIGEALNMHWQASAAGDLNAEHEIYDDAAICDYPQSGERILGRNKLQALRSHHPGHPSGFNIKRIMGRGDLWITEYTITYQERTAYTVRIMEFPRQKGCAGDTVFRGLLRGAGLATPMGSAQCLRPRSENTKSPRL